MPKSRETKVCTRKFDVLATSRAALISSFSTTTTPMPRASGHAATRTAFRQIESAIRAQSGRRPHCPDDHDRHRHLYGQVQEISGFLQRGGAMRHHDTGDRLSAATVACTSPTSRNQSVGANFGASDVLVSNRHDIGDAAEFRNTSDEFLDLHEAARCAVFVKIEPVPPDSRNGSPGADHGNSGLNSSRCDSPCPVKTGAAAKASLPRPATTCASQHNSSRWARGNLHSRSG